MISPWLAVLAGGLDPVPERSGSLLRAHWREFRDSIRLELAFEGGRPQRLRAGFDSSRPERFLLDLEGSVVVAQGESWPDWLTRRPRSDREGMGLALDLAHPARWRMRWQGDVLQVDLAAGGEVRPLWRKPWALALGAGVLAGVVWWIGTGTEDASENPTTPVDRGIIPPPDFGFP